MTTARSLLAALWIMLAGCLLVPAARAETVTPARWSTLAHNSFKHLAVPEATSTLALAQDHHGFVWLGTQAGLSRWDGYKLRYYAADRQRTDTLPDNFIFSLHVDPRGRLWIGTSAGGLARYDAEHDRFVQYRAGPGGVSHVRVSALAGDGEGGLWIGTGGGVDHMSAAGVLTQAGGGAPAIAARDLPAGGVDSLLRDRRGNLWIGTARGVLRRAPGSSKLEQVSLVSAGQPEPAVNGLYQDSSGRVWVGTRTRGALIIAEGTSTAVGVRESGPNPTIGSERVMSFVEVSPDEMWIGTEGMGILAVNPKGGPTRRIRHQADVADSLIDNDIYSLFRERSGLILAGTASALSQFDPHANAVTTVRQSGTPLDGAMSVAAVLERPDGRVWFGMPGGGVHIVDPVSTAASALIPGKSGLPTSRVLSLANAPGGEVYVGTQQGLFRTDAKGANPARVTLASRSPDAATWTLLFHGGAFWLGGLDGVWIYDAPGGVPGKLRRHETAGFGDTRVTALLPAPDGSMWVGTRAGLARFTPAGKVEQVTTDAVGSDTLPPGYVSSLLLDRRGRLWVAVFGGGVAVLEKTAPDGRHIFRRIGTADGLPHMGANAVQQDDTGAIWVSTDDGLAKIDPATFKVTAHGAAEGVHVRSYWTNSSVHTASGELLFGGLTGLTVVQPARAAAWTYKPPLVVTDVAVNDLAMPSGPFNAAGRGGAGEAAIDITPQARERGFTMDVAALDFASPEKNRYSYRLLGFDSRWITADAGTRRIGYTNLPPGDYTLQLRASSRGGDWSPIMAIPVRALPAWHQTIGMRILFALLLLGVLAGLLQARTAYLRGRQRELQDLVDERTAALQTSQRQLEKLAYADALTHLPNRRCFNDELRHMSARATREGDSFTLLLIDLDHFKQINDTMGHDAGDALLVEAAQRLQLAVREADRVARLGGDEFAVLLPLTSDKDSAAIIAGRIVASMAEPIMFGTQRMQISASIGGAAFGDAGANADALYKAADLALYDTKRRGRNGFSWRDAAITAEA